MSRILFVVPPLTGHINPTISLGKELAERGHAVAWAGYLDGMRKLFDENASMFIMKNRGYSLMQHDEIVEKGKNIHGLEAFRFLIADVLVPLCRAMVPELEAIIAQFRPDLMIVDNQAFAGALVGRKHHIPWISSVTTTAPIMDPLDFLAPVKEWVTNTLAKLPQEQNLESSPCWEYSDELVLVYSTLALVNRPEGFFPPQYRFVGPSAVEHRQNIEFPWEKLWEHKKKILVSLGTIHNDRSARFYAEIIPALENKDIQVILVAREEMLGRPLSAMPSNFIVRPFIPQIDLLAKVDAVVSHGGHNTVVETLSHGLPLVIAPIRDDQPVVAQQVVDAGAGIRVKFRRVRADDLQKAVISVLYEQTYRESAERLQKSLFAAGGVKAAANLVEQVVRRP